MSDSNGTGHTRLLYWVIGVQAAILLAIGAFLLDTLSDHSQDLRDTRVFVATLTAEMSSIKPLVEMIRTEQVDRTQRFAVLNEKILLLDQRVMAFSTRLDTQSQRILAINKRLDLLPHPPGSEPGGGFIP